DNAGNFEIAICRSRGANAKRLVGQLQVVRSAIRFAVDGDRLDAHLATSADYSQCDFTSIGNENALIHRAFRSVSERRGQSGERLFLNSEQGLTKLNSVTRFDKNGNDASRTLCWDFIKDLH